MSIFPYAYRMIETFELTENEDQISMYAGMLITAFAFAEFSTGMIWGRISDRLGRKPVLIMGLIGTSVSMVSFGFAKTLPGAIIARALGGLLNGNVGVLQTTVAELVTKKEHQPRAYSIMPFVWCLGSIIGPAMGGALAMPCEAYPWLFSKGSFFDTYPFLLPNLVCVIVLLLGITIGFLFLEETHPTRKYEADSGRELGTLLLGMFCGGRRTRAYDDKLAMHIAGELDGIADELPPGYRSTENSPKICATPTTSVMSDPESFNEKAKLGFGSTFSRQVMLIIIGYAILA